MPQTDPFPTGWVNEPERVLAVRSTLENEGKGGGVYTAPGGADLKGAWGRMVEQGVVKVTAPDIELKLNKTIRESDRQKYGVCASEAGFWSLQASIAFAIVMRAAVWKYTEISFEWLYGVARSVIRKGALGTGDGAVVADIALVGERFGFLLRKKYKSVDLTRRNEDLAREWGMPNAFIPPDLFEEAKKFHSIPMQADTIMEMADGMSQGHWANLGSIYYGNSGRGLSKGLMPLTRNGGGHAECRCGLLLVKKVKDVTDIQELMNATLFLTRGSWNPWPQASEADRMITLADGSLYRVPEGHYASTAADTHTALKNGEAWLSQVTKAPMPENMNEVWVPGQ